MIAEQELDTKQYLARLLEEYKREEAAIDKANTEIEERTRKVGLA